MPGFMTGYIEGQSALDRHEAMQLDIQRLRQDQASQQRMALLLQQEAAKGGNDKPGSIKESDHLSRMSELAAQSGRVDDAYKLMNMASQARIHEANAAYKETRTALNLGKAAETILAGATDEESWQRNQMLFTAQTGQPSPFEGIPFSEENVKAIREAIAHDKAVASAAESQARLPLIEAQIRATKAKAALDEAKTTTEETDKRNLIKAQAKASEIRATTIRKSGGTGAKAPNKDQLKAIVDLMALDFPDLPTNSEETRTIARPIAERAMELMRAHPGMRASEADAQAYGEAQQAGVFDGYMRANLRHAKPRSATADLPEGFQLDK